MQTERLVRPCAWANWNLPLETWPGIMPAWESQRNYIAAQLIYGHFASLKERSTSFCRQFLQIISIDPSQASKNGRAQPLLHQPSYLILQGEGIMGNEDVAAGKAKQLKGKLNDVAGAITGNTRRQVKGNVQKAAGKIQEALGKASAANFGSDEE
jgi:uncharacterized protein YjbJ (UPF0337 family)